MKVFKYPLEANISGTIRLPHGYRILSVAMIAGQLYVWAMVNPKMPTIDVQIWVIGTGFTLPEKPLSFIGTVVENEGEYVWHVFVTTHSGGLV